MEILRQSFKKIVLDSFYGFQREILDIFTRVIENLDYNKISNDSFIDQGVFIDLIFISADDGLTFGFSIREEVFVINSKYFDIYIYPETSIYKIEVLISDIFLGRYFVIEKYGKKGKLVSNEFLFDRKELQVYNSSNKIAFFSRRIVLEKKIKGVNLLRNIIS